MVVKKFNHGDKNVLMTLFKPYNIDLDIKSLALNNKINLITLSDIEYTFYSINYLNSLYFEDINYTFIKFLYESKHKLIMNFYSEIEMIIDKYEIKYFIWTINPNLLHIDFTNKLRTKTNLIYWNLSGKSDIYNSFIEGRFDNFFHIDINSNYKELTIKNSYTRGVIPDNLLEFESVDKEIDILFIAKDRKRNRNIMKYFYKNYNAMIVGNSWKRPSFLSKLLYGKYFDEVKQYKDVDIYDLLKKSKIVVILDMDVLSYHIQPIGFMFGAITYSNSSVDEQFSSYSLKDMHYKNIIKRLISTEYLSDKIFLNNEYSFSKSFKFIINLLGEQNVKNK